jgi:hypothetical protein
MLSVTYKHFMLNVVGPFFQASKIFADDQKYP